jgi:hypothetical protein
VLLVLIEIKKVKENYFERQLIIVLRTLMRSSSDIFEPEGRHKPFVNNSSEVPFK